jgi:hypothetical protein
MADASWIADILKVLGGALAGVGVKAWSDRWKLRRTRRLLYKEIAYNYGMLHTELHDGPHTELMKGKSPVFSFEYYEHAKKDLDAFHTLRESQLINGFYHHLMSITEADPLKRSGNLANAMFAYGGIHDAAEDGRLNAKLLLKQATPYNQRLLNRNIELVHQERKEMSEDARRRRVMVLPDTHGIGLPKSSEKSE